MLINVLQCIIIPLASLVNPSGVNNPTQMDSSISLGGLVFFYIVKKISKQYKYFFKKNLRF